MSMNEEAQFLRDNYSDTELRQFANWLMMAQYHLEDAIKFLKKLPDSDTTDLDDYLSDIRKTREWVQEAHVDS